MIEVLQNLLDNFFIQTLLKISALLLLFVLPLAALMTFFERKWSALIQDRVGPNRANASSFRLKGLLHIAADGLKSIFKEDFIAQGSNKFLYTLAPMFSFLAAFSMFSIIPIAGPIDTFRFQIADFNLGLLMVFAFTSLGVYGSVIAGWSTDSKYALLGSVRSTSQMISYEVFLGLSLVGLFMVHESLQISKIVADQNTYWFNGWIPKWGIFTQPLGCLIFLIAMIAETKRAPFDAPEGESEIIAGYFIEYSGMRFVSFFLAEYISLIGVSALVTTLFLGSYHLPFLHQDGLHFGELLFIALPTWLIVLLQIASFIIKVIFMCWLQLMLRWTLPRFRFDQIMTLGWNKLLPLSLANVVITGFIILLIESL